MNLSTEDILNFCQLIEIGDSLFNLYFENNPEEHIETIRNLIEQEHDLTDKLNINVFKFDALLQLIRAEIGELPTINLLIGTNPNIKSKIDPNLENETNSNHKVSIYAYFRTIAHLKHRLNLYGEGYKPFARVFVDQEVSILYKFLNEVALNIPQEISILYRSLNNANFNIPKEQSELKKCAYQILIDSPKIEKEILLNNLQPHQNLTTIYNPDRALYLIHNITKKLLYNLRLPRASTYYEFLFSLNYLKTIIMYFRPENRKEIVNQVLDEEARNSDFSNIVPRLKEFIDPIFDEIEKSENPKIHHLKLVSTK